jgi:Domain of unknown function (DUF4372)
VPHFRSALNRILEPLDGREMGRIVARHDGDHGVGSGPRSWTCVRHLKTLLFAQFSGLSSLRELSDGMAAQPASLCHLGLKLHIGFGARETLLDWVEVTTPRISHINAARAISLTSGTIYVDDKGYLDSGWWQ